MRWVRGARIGTLVVVVALRAAACGGGDDTGGPSGSTAPAVAAKKAGVVFDIGGLGDKSFNDSANRGATEAKQKLGNQLDLRVVEPNADGSNALCTENKNLLCIGFKEQEGSFLVGAAAALKTKSNTVGFVGGLLGDLIKKFEAGYRADVEYIHKELRKTVKGLVD